MLVLIEPVLVLRTLLRTSRWKWSYWLKYILNPYNIVILVGFEILEMSKMTSFGPYCPMSYMPLEIHDVIQSFFFSASQATNLHVSLFLTNQAFLSLCISSLSLLTLPLPQPIAPTALGANGVL